MNQMLLSTEIMEKSMEWFAAKFKLEEAEYFHQQVLANYNDDRLLTFYFNAMFQSGRSVLDYVWSSFLVGGVKPSVSSQKWFNDEDYRKDIRKTHPESKLIQRFEKFWRDKKSELNDDPLMYHLLKKRDVITHHRYAGSMGGLYTGTPSGEIWKDRYLETMWAETYLEKKPELRIDFGKDISKDERKELEDKLRRKDMRPVLEFYIKKLGEFIKEFEELDLEKMR